MNSMLEIQQPARQAMAIPSPVAPRGAVERDRPVPRRRSQGR